MIAKSSVRLFGAAIEKHAETGRFARMIATQTPSIGPQSRMITYASKQSNVPHLQSSKTQEDYAPKPKVNIEQLQEDLYPSRKDEASWYPRRHPIVWNKERALESGPLTQEQVETYETNGYFVMRNVFNEKELAILTNEMNQLREHAEKMAEKDQDAKVTDGTKFATEPSTGRVRSVFEVHKNSQICNRVLADERLVKAASQILDSDVYIHQSRINFQLPFVGTGFWYHSDFETWHCEDGMPLPRALSMVIMMNDNISQNGALMVSPGSHNTFIQCAGETPARNWETSLKGKQKYGTPDLDSLTELINIHGLEYCTGKRGDVLMFDSNLMHASHNNISPWPRSNMFAVFNSVKNRLVKPFAAPMERPEHIANRDPKWNQGIKAQNGKLTDFANKNQ